uniref:Abnormal cell migration protein 18-like fibronectin type I domain-containing protein n=1 Tax=Plectus sambesii TaxID=2011161 RepID=A0A914UYU1_9BILA
MLFLPACVLFLCFSLATACTSDGKKRKDGEEWKKNNYIFGCKIEKSGAWKVGVVGCLTPAGKELRNGQSATEGGNELTCVTNPNGSGILNQKPKSGATSKAATPAAAATSCTIPSGKKLKAGEKFTEGNDQVGITNYECDAKGNLLISSVCPTCAGVKCATKCSCGMCAH